MFNETTVSVIQQLLFTSCANFTLKSFPISKGPKRHSETRTRLQDPVAGTERQCYSSFFCRLLPFSDGHVFMTLPAFWGKTWGPSPTDLLGSGWTARSNPADGKLCTKREQVNPAVWPAHGRSSILSNVWDKLKMFPEHVFSGLGFKREAYLCAWFCCLPLSRLQHSPANT